MQIISKLEKDRLVKQALLESYSTNEYLQDENDSNLVLMADLFFNEDIDRAIKFNVGSGVFKTVSDVLAFFVGSPKTSLDINLEPYTRDLVSVGQAVFGIEQIDGVKSLYYVLGRDYLNTNGEDKVVKLYAQEEDGAYVYYMLVQKFLVGTTENTLYRLKDVNGTDGDIVPLDTIPQTETLQDVEQTGLDTPAVFVVKAKGDSVLKENISELDKIKNLVYSLDRKQMMFETQFLQEMEQYKIFENIVPSKDAYNADGTIDINKMGKIVSISPGDSWDIRYVSNENKLIQDAIKYEQTQLQKVTGLTTIPQDFLGLDTQGAISGTSREIMISAFTKKVESMRDMFENELIKILTVFEWQSNENGDSITTEIYWNNILNNEGKTLAEELSIARGAGIISQYTSVQKYLGLNTEEEVQKELDKISLTEATDETDNTDTV